MAESTGLVLATGIIALTNEALLAPLAKGTSPVDAPAVIANINWRIVPATAILALALAGLEKLSEPLAVGLAGLGLLAILIVPVSNQPSIMENAATILGVK